VSTSAQYSEAGALGRRRGRCRSGNKIDTAIYSLSHSKPRR
jgi:hypothetical protein